MVDGTLTTCEVLQGDTVSSGRGSVVVHSASLAVLPSLRGGVGGSQGWVSLCVT